MNTTDITERITTIEEQNKDIEARLARLEAQVEEWNELLKLIAEARREAKRNNATLTLREVIDPYAETTTVKQLLHMLESECPVKTVLDALLLKELTDEEKKRLASNLYDISRESIYAVNALDGFLDISVLYSQREDNVNEEATQEQEALLQDV